MKVYWIDNSQNKGFSVIILEMKSCNYKGMIKLVEMDEKITFFEQMDEFLYVIFLWQLS